MKKLIFVCGPNGVGKSTACRELLHQLDKTAYVDSEWLGPKAWNPFVHNTETIALLKSTMFQLLSSYLKSSAFHNIIWHYGFHGRRKEIYDDVMEQLSQLPIDFQYIPIIFECSIAQQIDRMKADKRDVSRIQRAIDHTREIYDSYDFHRINVSHLSVQDTVKEMLKVIHSYDT